MTPSRLGRYDITGTLGQGAMGIVYRAHDPLIERAVAIKTVACAGLPEKEAEEFEQRFFREAKSAGKLNHPNIVPVYDIVEHESRLYVVMRYVRGKSLRQVLDEQRRRRGGSGSRPPRVWLVHWRPPRSHGTGAGRRSRR